MPDTPEQSEFVEFTVLELGGASYAVVPVAVFASLGRKAGVRVRPRGGAHPSSLDMAAPEQIDGAGLAQRIAERRKAARLTQAELAQLAGVRVETVNRIERGHVTPDFGTIRKLVQAMLDAENAASGPHRPSRKPKEKSHARQTR